MRIHAIGGLSGTLIEYRVIDPSQDEGNAYAIVLRDQPPFPSRPYSVHHLFGMPGSTAQYPGEALIAYNGAYDLTLDEARAELARRLNGASRW